MESQSLARDIQQKADHTPCESREHDFVIALTDDQLEEISGEIVAVASY